VAGQPDLPGARQREEPPTSNDATPSTGYRVPTHEGPLRPKPLPLPQFVKTLRGGHFFAPSRSLLAFLGRPPEAGPPGAAAPAA
jgi:hypothetical protein